METSTKKADTAYRLQPNIKNSLIVFFFYLVIVFSVQKMSGVPYDEITKNSDNLLKGVLLSVVASSVYLTIVAKWSGWWNDVFHDKYKIKGHGWMNLLVVFAVLGTIVNVASGKIGDLDTTFILYALIATALVGYSEELMTRGLLVRGARGSGLTEIKVFLFSSLLFGLMHALNVFNGQALSTTIQQVGFTFLAGGVYYAIFRKTGLLWVTMVLHALWDFSLLTNGSDVNEAATVNSSGIANALFTYGTYIVLFASIHLFNVKASKAKTKEATA